MTASHLAWLICLIATAGVILRPLRWPEAVWACGGAALIVLLGLLPIPAALHAIGEGTDVYLFLIGMMLLSEIARREGLFDWIAAYAVNHARGSTTRLFVLVYVLGVGVTALLSNDATAVVMTPAVFAVARKANAPALPLLLICALVANAASFVLPISNPANLVLYGNHMPPLGAWLRSFALPSLLAIVATFALLWLTQRRQLGGRCNQAPQIPPLSSHGRVALASIVVTALVLLAVSALDMRLGLPTAILGLLTLVFVCTQQRSAPWPILRDISWSVLPLVAGLFVLVQVLDHTGVIQALASWLVTQTQTNAPRAAAFAAAAVGLGSNAINNLPAGLIASSSLTQAHSLSAVVDAVLIAVDLGPNLSVTGSLATILWLGALRREGMSVSFWQFFKVGVVVMPPALLLAVGARLWLGQF
ncbi:arsenic transporter [Silvimonas sp. JCM 19000]